MPLSSQGCLWGDMEFQDAWQLVGPPRTSLLQASVGHTGAYFRCCVLESGIKLVLRASVGSCGRGGKSTFRAAHSVNGPSDSQRPHGEHSYAITVDTTPLHILREATQKKSPALYLLNKGDQPPRCESPTVSAKNNTLYFSEVTSQAIP